MTARAQGQDMQTRNFLAIISLLSFSAWLDLLSILTFAGFTLELSPIGLAAVSVSMLAPQALLSRVFSNQLQRHATHRILLLSTGCRVILTLCLFFTTTLPFLLMLLAFRSVAIGFLQPAIAASSNEVSKQSASGFASSVNLINTISKIGAPALGGAIAVRFGEPAVFLISAGLSASALLLISRTEFSLRSAQCDNQPAAPTPQARPLHAITFLLAIAVLSAASGLFTNMLPFTLNHYAFPKSYLSIALVASAAGSIALNLIILRRAPLITDLPVGHMAVSWLLMGVSLLCLSISLLLGDLALVAIPLSFTLVACSRTYFEIVSNGFIFAQPKNDSIVLSASKQSAMAYSAILGTIVGALGLSQYSPAGFLTFVSGLTVATCAIWYVYFYRR